MFTGKKGLWEKAVAMLEMGVGKNPEIPVLANNLACLYMERDMNVNKAFALAQSAYERAPKDPAMADTLGWAFYKQKLFTRAVWLLEEASSRKPDHALIHFHLGMTFYAQGNMASAIKSLKRALALQLNSPYREEAEGLLKELNAYRGT